MPINLVLADDHPLVLAGLDLLFRQDEAFQVLACCQDGEEALAAVRRHRPDVLIVDLKMPRKDGLAVLREIAEAKLPTRVVLLTAALDDAQVVEAVRLGVGGVVLKENATQAVVRAVREVHAGRQWFEQRSVGDALKSMVKRDAGRRETAGILTQRELEIVRMVARGLRNKEIGKKLFISEGTVKIHLHNIYEKVKVGGRLELTLFAQNKGLVE